MLSLLLTAAVAASSVDAVAQAPEPAPIIVEGQKRPTEKQALRTVTDMTMIVESQIARFHDPVCPLVVGMARSAAIMVENRIRATVEEIGGRTAEPGCEGNLLLFIAGDGAGLFKDIQTKRPQWLAGVSSSDKARLESDGPVRAWSVSSVRSEDGRRATRRAKGAVQTDGNGHWMASEGLLDKVPQMRVYGSSFIQKQSRYHLDGSVVIIDADAAEGLTLRQLGEYAALRGLVRIREPAGVGQMDSILSIFDRPRESAPRQLTSFDRGYLGSLYGQLRLKGYESSVHERRRLARAIADQD